MVASSRDLWCFHLVVITHPDAWTETVRRGRVGRIGGVIGIGLLWLLLAAPASARPNFVIMLTDDQRWDAVGVVQRELGAAGRLPWLAAATPNLDRIAREGFRFRNAFAVSSLCSPSRAAILTGRYNHLNGVANNHTPFPVANVTYASLLGAAGYRTGYFGKWHMGSQRERPEPPGLLKSFEIFSSLGKSLEL